MRALLWLLGLIAVPTVAGPQRQRAAVPVTFVDHVLPVLQRHGCASAYCHGSANGQGGFKLSLFGSDPDADWRALAVDLDGRRLDLRDAERSLVLRKGSGRARHGGGMRLPRDSAAYALLRDWIAAGADRGPDQPAVADLTLELVGARLRVTATMAGRSVDVSALATFGSSEPTVATVADDGSVTFVGPGETFLTARYAGRDAVLRLMRPVGGADPIPATAHAADRAWLAWLGELGLPPAPRAAPLRLARRLYLDLLGRPPAPHEVRAFEALPVATALAVTVERLLATPAFVDEFTRHLAAMFELADAPTAMAAGRDAALRDHLRAAVAANQSLDELAAELLVPGSPLLERFGDPRDRAEFVGRAFLGLQIGCARCHDHPQDRWRQRDHQGLAALLATRRAGGGELMAGAVFDETTGDACAPRMLAIAPPQPLPATADPAVRHGALRAAVLVASDAFARNVCNRLLGWLLGRAPVEPVDDHRLANPPRCAPLLAAAVAEYRRTRGDLRALVRWVVTSAVWAADSEPVGDHDELAARYLARQQARPWSADLLARASAYVLDVPPPLLPADPLARELARRHGDWTAAAVRAPGGAIDLIAATGDDAVALAELFLQILGRPPRPDERAALLPRLAPPPRRERFAELAAALLLTREFASRR